MKPITPYDNITNHNSTPFAWAVCYYSIQSEDWCEYYFNSLDAAQEFAESQKFDAENLFITTASFNKRGMLVPNNKED